MMKPLTRLLPAASLAVAAALINPHAHAGTPGYCDPLKGSPQYALCIAAGNEEAGPQVAAAAGTPVCNQSTSQGGADPCKACLSATGDQFGNPSTTWACGNGMGGTPIDGSSKPPCTVNSVATGRTPPDCDGNMVLESGLYVIHK